LPRFEDLPATGDGLDPERVREAFDAFRRHASQLQAQLRVLQAAGRSAGVEPSGHAVRMDALHLIRAAADFADTIERDAQNASASQLGKTEEEVRRRQNELQDREAEVERYRQESERQRAEMMNAAKSESRQTLQEAQQQAAQEITEAEARAARLLEQARHQATELTNSVRAEVEQTLEWSRAQAGVIISRAQEGAEQLLSAAGLGDDAIDRVAQTIVSAAEAATEASRGTSSPANPPKLSEPEAVEDAPAPEESESPPLSPPASPGPSPPGPQDTGSQSEDESTS